MFDLIQGLPLHPLVVHAAVVLWPLGILGLLAMLLLPRLRERFGWLNIAFVVLGAAAIYVSKESGEKLAHRIGEPKTHAEYADMLTAVAFVTMLVTLVWWVLDRRYHRAVLHADRRDDSVDGRPVGYTGELPKRPMLNRLLGALAGLLGLWSLAMTVGVGHTGAEAAWKDRVTPTASSSATPSASASSSASASTATYTLDQVKQHSTTTDCWAAIKAPGESTTGVYDLTQWVSQHPGGADKIEGLCGTDGTSAFVGKHGEDGANGAPEQRLAGFKIGTLAG